jgi:signal transduction histidine kinase
MHLLDAISDIIDIFQIEADRLTFEETNFSLLQAIDQTIYIQKAQAQAKGLSLARDTPLALPDLLFGNALRLKQILINFIGNAIKFSTHGQITVHAPYCSHRSGHRH